MLSSDRSQPRASRRRRAGRRSGRARDAAGAGHASDRAAWDEAQPFDPNEPWDPHAAEALTRLFESEEGRLSRPADTLRKPWVCAEADAIPDATAAEPVERSWLEAHLSRLVERLNDTLSRSSAEPRVAALNARLEAIEERFGAALGRVAQRADMEGLRSIEVHVLELAAQLERARERLDEIGAVDGEVRALARRLDETSEQRANALEKLLRESMAEWREGEQRAAGALHNLEEAINRLGDTLDAMEASKPALDLSVPAFADPETASRAGIARFPGRDEPITAHFYRTTLDADDYAPRAIPDGPLSPSEPPFPGAGREHPASPPGVVEWSAARPGGGLVGQHGARLTPGALRVIAMRAKLRRSSGIGIRRAGGDWRPAASLGRASFGLLLMAGAAVLLAGSTYVLYHALARPAPPASPVMIKPQVPPAVKSDLGRPATPRSPGQGAS
jgi:hypothetical protein